MDVPSDSVPHSAPKPVARPCPSENCTLPVDIILRSSDGVLIGTHVRNLASYGAGFAPADFAPGDEAEIVELTENAAVLEILLQFMHPGQQQPDSTKWAFGTLKDVAEAVEKYIIHCARQVCYLQMAAATSSHSLDVLSYAVKHDYDTLRDQIIPTTLALPAESMDSILGNTRFSLAWFRYREQYLTVGSAILNSCPSAMLHKGGLTTCAEWDAFWSKIPKSIATPGGLDRLGDFPNFFDTERYRSIPLCSYCFKRASLWSAAIHEKCATLRPYKSFL
ncbi:hypothetical protein MKEN_00169800 [Mycena kentingensis (nom. inval.)]|nr:hypothetical protein MKEN_00169800 [Mycena kentingensis (nom. inval.)]